MNIQHSISSLTLIGMSFVFFGQDVSAAFQIRVTSGSSSWTVTDNAANDLDYLTIGSHTDGLISTADVFGWGDLSFTAGISKPIVGSADNPVMNLSALRLSTWSPLAKSLKIELTDTDFTGAPGGLQPMTLASSIGGLTAGTVEYQVFADSNNQPFGKSQPLGSAYQYSNSGGNGPAFHSSWSGSAGVTEPFSITMQAIIRHAGPGVSAFDAELKAVPEPISLIAWACLIPVLGLAYYQHCKSQGVKARAIA
jgi:hypothetical protein